MGLTDSLISFWELEEASGTRNDAHGTNHLSDNGSVGSASGTVGTAADFESTSSQFLDHADNAELSTGDIDFTIAAWVNIESRGVGERCIVGKANAATEYILEDVQSGPFNGFTFFVGASNVASAFGQPIIGVWYYVVAWHDSVANTINIQVNNGAVDTTTGVTGPTDGGEPFQIGRYGTGQYFDGLIDQVGFWKRVLTSQERTDLYNGGAGLSYAAMGGGAGSGGAVLVMN